MKITDIVTMTAMSALLVSILVRMRPKSRKTYAPLLWVQVSIIATLSLSLSWTYPTLDKALGGLNYVNLILHLIFLGASWVYTTVIAEAFFRNRPKPATMRLWVPITAAIGSTACFILLGANGTSRGMEAFTNEPAWIGYWVFNIMTLWMPAFSLVPRLLEAVQHTKIKSLRVAYWAIIIGYSTSILAVFGYVATYFSPALIIVREALVLITELGLITSLIVIPVLSHQQHTEQCTRKQAQQEAAARFNR